MDLPQADLAIEYRQWKFAKTLVERFMLLAEEKGKKNIDAQREATNIIERWIMSQQQDEEREIDPSLPLFPILPSDHEIHKKLALDAMDKGFCVMKRTANILSGKLVQYVNNFRDKCRQEVPDIPDIRMEKDSPDCDEAKIIIGKFQSPKSIRFLFLVNNFGLETTGTMVLRYEAAGSGSYQWGDPISVHRLYYREFQARYEGFSSPMNSRFLGQKDARFCSVFPDTDAPFGSMGSFFKIDLSKHQGGWSVNPPFIETVLEEAAVKVLDALEAGLNSWFFMNYPDWRDSKGWQRLDDSKFKVRRFDFVHGDFLVQDAYGRASRPRMKLSIFVMGNIPKECPSVELLKDTVCNARPPSTRSAVGTTLDGDMTQRIF